MTATPIVIPLAPFGLYHFSPGGGGAKAIPAALVPSGPYHLGWRPSRFSPLTPSGLYHLRRDGGGGESDGAPSRYRLGYHFSPDGSPLRPPLGTFRAVPPRPRRGDQFVNL